MTERVLVIGGTRGTGLEIVRRLVEDGYRVRALARREPVARGRLGAAVEVVPGDVREAPTLKAAARGVDHIIFTAGVTKRPAGERVIRETNYDGIRNALAASRDEGVPGRFLYMTSIGVTRFSPLAASLNLVKRRTLYWRRLAEELVRESGLSYTIVRAGVLMNDAPGRRPVQVSQNDYPLRFRYRVGRADVASVFVLALKHPRTPFTTFDVVWGRKGFREAVEAQLDHLKTDRERASRASRGR
ncbi:MAG: SDR family oxidoreductase [Gemmatimonadota bacterium]